MSALVHIGYHKTASTWLQVHLFKHPDVGLRSIGKSAIDVRARELVSTRALEFDAQAVRERFAPALDEVRERGLLPVVSNERLSGHPVSGGFDSKEIADRLAEVFPGAKVLMVIREQRSMIRSVYKQYVLAGGPCTFPKFVDGPEDPNARVPQFDLGFYQYDRLLRHYRSRFGDGNVLALPYEQFVRDPPGFVEAIGAFAGRPIAPEVAGSMKFREVRHRTPPAVMIGLTRWGNRLARRSQYHPAPVVDSPRLFAGVQRVARSETVRGLVPRRLLESRDRALEAMIEAAVGDRYVESNRRTAELTGLDLGGYGWAV